MDQRTQGHVPAKVRLNDTDHPSGQQYRAQLRASVTLAEENWRTVPTGPGKLGRVKAAVRDLLRDPESARFEGLFAVESSAASRYVCGQVNAKNAYGGYAGRQPFGFDPSTNRALLFGDISYWSSISPTKMTRDRPHGQEIRSRSRDR